jgi:hypothetical protein
MTICSKFGTSGIGAKAGSGVSVGRGDGVTDGRGVSVAVAVSGADVSPEHAVRSSRQSAALFQIMNASLFQNCLLLYHRFNQPAI